MDKLESERRRIVDFCLEAQNWTVDQLKAGVLASDVAKNHESVIVVNDNDKDVKIKVTLYFVVKDCYEDIEIP